MKCLICRHEMSDRPEERHGFLDSYEDTDGGIHIMDIVHPDGDVCVTHYTAEERARLQAWLSIRKEVRHEPDPAHRRLQAQP